MASASARKTAERWVRIPSDRAAIEAGCYFDPEAADRVCEFFERFLRHSAGEWAARPFVLQLWQRDYLSRLYGWKKATGYRRFRETYLEVPKKNGKSTLFSGICLWSIFEEPGAQVFIGASTRKQASIIFDECACMVRASPDLSRHLHVVEHTKTITFPRMNAKLVAWSSDTKGNDGANASTIVLDEVHRFPNRKMYDVAKYAGRARKQPLLVEITTAGTDRHSLCYQLHQRAKSVLDGTVDDVGFLPVIYAADKEKDDLDDPATWHRANPSLGVLFDEESFRNDFQEARRLPGQWNNFLRLSLNIWTEQATLWLALELWDACLEIPDSWTWSGKSCYAALDVSTNKDLTALSLLFVEEDLLRSFTFFFVPEETAEKRGEVDKVPYPQWIADGHVIGTPGNSTDYGAIRAKLNDLREAGLEVKKLGIDPWNARQLANQLRDDDGFDVEFIPQRYEHLSPPSKELERLLLRGAFRQDGNPVQRWCVANVATETDASENIRPSKRRSAERIDGVVAMVMAIGLAMAYPDHGPPSITILGDDD